MEETKSTGTSGESHFKISKQKLVGMTSLMILSPCFSLYRIQTSQEKNYSIDPSNLVKIVICLLGNKIPRLTVPQNHQIEKVNYLRRQKKVRWTRESNRISGATYVCEYWANHLLLFTDICVPPKFMGLNF